MECRCVVFLSVLMIGSCLGAVGHPAAAGQEQQKSQTKQEPKLDLLTAVQKHDSARARALLEQGADPNIKDKDGMSAFLTAVANKDRDLVDLMLAKGAKINESGPDGVTALIMSVADSADTGVMNLLLEHGAALAPHSKTGSTALTLATSNGNHSAVEALLQKGADVNAKGRYEDTPLLIAARKGDRQIVSALPEKGADPNALSNVGETALIEAARRGNREIGKLLLTRGADARAVNHEGRSVLMFAVQSGTLEFVRSLVAAGVDVNIRDNAGRTALMAARGENAAEIVPLLIAMGADVDACDRYGCTALMRAAMGSDVRVVRALLAAGAKPKLKDGRGHTALMRARAIDGEEVVQALTVQGEGGSRSAHSRIDYLRDAVQTSLPLLQSTAAAFQKQAGSECFSCHHQSLPAFTVGLARSRGFQIDTKLAHGQSAFVLGFYQKCRSLAVKGMNNTETGNNVGEMFPGRASHIGYGILGLAADSVKPDPSTEAVALYLTKIQEKDGRWKSACTVRDPAEKSDFTETALSIHTLRDFVSSAHAKETALALERAKGWLIKTPPQNTEDRSFQLLGLAWACVGLEYPVVRSAVRALLADQRSDGSWGHNPSIKSDAYATGEALVALHLAGGLPVESAAYRRGVDFLLRTQEEDGSWFVQSRTVPFQPYFETGFPYGKDQFISCSATCWATAALALAAPMPQTTARR